MQLHRLLASAKEEAERAAMLWYATDSSDNAAPHGACHIVVTDPDVGDRLVASEQAAPVLGGVQLVQRWEHPSDDLPMARHWSTGFANALRRAGVACHTVDAPSGALDTSSLRRGLKQLADLGVISARTAGATRQASVVVSRAGRKAPFVLELGAQAMRSAAAEAYVAAAEASGLSVQRTGEEARVRLSDDVSGAVDAVVQAMRALFEHEPGTIAAYPAGQEARPW